MEAYHPYHWKRGATSSLLVKNARPGDTIANHGDLASWVKVKRGLLKRGLAVVSVGQRFYIAPESSLAQLPLLRELAAAAQSDRASRLALRDFALEFFGEHCHPRCGLAESLARASAPEHAAVPGNLADAAARKKKEKEERQEQEAAIERRRQSERRS